MFKLQSEPRDLQLSVHICNMVATYGYETMMSLKATSMATTKPEIAMKNIINHYGEIAVQNYICLVYNSNKKAKGA